MRIHKEGRPTLIFMALFLIILNFGVYSTSVEFRIAAAAFSVAVFCFFLNFFRNPERKIHAGPNVLLAPADGKVVVIEETVETEFFKDKRIQVSIFMSPFNVHVNRNPISGLVKYFKYHPGKYLFAFHPKSSTENERTSMVFTHESGQEILMRQVAGFLARRIVWYLNEGQEVKQGEQMGFIKFGSRVDLFLPLGTKVCVPLNDTVRGGETVLTEFN